MTPEREKYLREHYADPENANRHGEELFEEIDRLRSLHEVYDRLFSKHVMIPSDGYEKQILKLMDKDKIIFELRNQVERQKIVIAQQERYRKGISDALKDE